MTQVSAEEVAHKDAMDRRRPPMNEADWLMATARSMMRGERLINLPSPATFSGPRRVAYMKCIAILAAAAVDVLVQEHDILAADAGEDMIDD